MTSPTRSVEISPNPWRRQFAEKMKDARRDRFEAFADQALTPVFDEYRVFTSGLGLSGTALPSRRGVRRFKFAMTEDAYVLISFLEIGLERIDVLRESAFPHDSKRSSRLTSAGLMTADTAWARRTFEQALEQFADEAIVHTLGGDRSRTSSTT